MNVYLYILIMALTTYAVRVLPLTLLQKPIENRFFRSFLYYVPYVTLSVMTFLEVLSVTESPITALIALLVAGGAAWLGLGLFPVSLISGAVVLALEFFI